MRPPGATLPWLAAAWGAASGPLLAQDMPMLPVQQPQVLEATRFATTTTVNLQINGVLGALQYSGSEVDSVSNTAAGGPLLNGVSFNHDLRLTVDTSFTGQDLFRIRLRSGNFAPSGFFSNPPTPLSRLDVAFQEPACGVGEEGCSGGRVNINRAYLQLPLSPEIRVSFGPRIMQLDMLPVWPSVYNASPILDLFQYAGSPGTYSKRLGGGFGLWWQPTGGLQGLSLGYAYVAGRAGGSQQGGGLFSGSSSQTSTLQLALSRPQWNITGAYSVSGPQVRLRGTPLASQLAAGASDGSLGSWSLAGYWQPRRSGWLPSISAGWGEDRFRFGSPAVAGLSGVRSRSWYTGLVWSDVLGAGNSLGFAAGSPAQVIAIQTPSQSGIDDKGLAFELFYRIQVSDELSVTPALFWLSRPRGALGGSTDLSQALLFPAASGDTSLGVWAGLIRTTLRF
ncbi:MULTISPECIES: carbohydrate porin [unclassified Cyanobium]|uniref:carbohydrate porin n=1 Tax=unclassified Cyanobium TaxID=2627006 RepID=UPI0020CB971C|nr:MULTISPECIES: carbohydrate porin [unclassified Cyanobium]MCP9835434.1 carbohydrate porin [Cyanobium sp. La Preciosa 7G6]MCP9938161.1 carbohydrate porin [Cyanobium sp. Aljojuca 7A6]